MTPFYDNETPKQISLKQFLIQHGCTGWCTYLSQIWHGDRAGHTKLPQDDTLLFHWFRKELLSICFQAVGNFLKCVSLLLGIFIFFLGSQKWEFFSKRCRQCIFHVENSLFFVETWYFITPGGPLGIKNSPLVVRFIPEHLNMTHRNPLSWYQQPADQLEAILEPYCKDPGENWRFWGIFEKTD